MLQNKFGMECVIDNNIPIPVLSALRRALFLSKPQKLCRDANGVRNPHHASLLATDTSSIHSTLTLLWKKMPSVNAYTFILFWLMDWCDLPTTQSTFTTPVTFAHSHIHTTGEATIESTSDQTFPACTGVLQISDGSVLMHASAMMAIVWLWREVSLMCLLCLLHSFLGWPLYCQL